MNTTSENARPATASNGERDRPPISVPMLDEVYERLSGNDPRLTQHVTDELVARGTEMLVATYHVQMLCDEATFAENADREKLIALSEASRRVLHEVLISAISGHVYAVGGEQRREYESRLKLLTLVKDDAAMTSAAAPAPLFRIVRDNACPVPIMPFDGDGDQRVADGDVYFTAEQAAAALPGRTVDELVKLWRDAMRDVGLDVAQPEPKAGVASIASEAATAPVVDPFDYPDTLVDEQNRRNAQRPADFPVGRRIFTREHDGGFVVANDGERVYAWGVFDDGDEPGVLYNEIGDGISTNDSPVTDPDDPGGFEAYAVVQATIDRLMYDPFVGMVVKHHAGEVGTVAFVNGLAIVAIVDARRLELWERADCLVLIDQPRRDLAVIKAILSLMPVEGVPPPAAKSDVVDTPATSEAAA